MIATPEQNWQPITMLPTIAQVLTDMLDGAAEQRDLLAGARPTASITPPSTTLNGSTAREWTDTWPSRTKRTWIGQRHGSLMHPCG
jgi:hypothetical protein